MFPNTTSDFYRNKFVYGDFMIVYGRNLNKSNSCKTSAMLIHMNICVLLHRSNVLEHRLMNPTRTVISFQGAPMCLVVQD